MKTGKIMVVGLIGLGEPLEVARRRPTSSKGSLNCRAKRESQEPS